MKEDKNLWQLTDNEKSSWAFSSDDLFSEKIEESDKENES